MRQWGVILIMRLYKINALYGMLFSEHADRFKMCFIHEDEFQTYTLLLIRGHFAYLHELNDTFQCQRSLMYLICTCRTSSSHSWRSYMNPQATYRMTLSDLIRSARIGLLNINFLNIQWIFKRQNMILVFCKLIY